MACDVPDDVLRLAAALEAKSEHPLARAVDDLCDRARPGAVAAAESFEAVVREGVRGVVEGREVFVGVGKAEGEGAEAGASGSLVSVDGAPQVASSSATSPSRTRRPRCASWPAISP